MANRFSSWEEGLCKELLASKKKRHHLFLAMRQDFENDLEILRALCQVMGLKEFSGLCGLAPSNVSKYLKQGRDLKLSTLGKLAAPFGVKLLNIPVAA
jgi:hypothetical protein